MIPTRPDIFAANGSREEIVVDFGSVSHVSPDGAIVDATLDTRIVLSPHIARRVSILLENHVRKHEDAFGPLTVETSTRPSISDVLFDPVPGLSTDDNASRAVALFDSIERLGIPYAYERSFKMGVGTILPNRFLCGIKRDFLGADADRILVDLCRRLGMPQDHLELFAAGVHLASYVHFGFEEGVGGSLYKVYLEYDVGLKPERADIKVMPAEPFSLHTAFKWSPSDDTVRAIGRYTGFPFMTKDAIKTRIADIYRDDRHQVSLEFADQIVDLAHERFPRHGFFYMEVVEDGNPRRSFDVKVYEARLSMRELFPQVDKLRKHYGIPDDRFLPMYERIKASTFGHVTGGIDRGGNGFLTLYHGVGWR